MGHPYLSWSLPGRLPAGPHLVSTKVLTTIHYLFSLPDTPEAHSILFPFYSCRTEAPRRLQMHKCIWHAAPLHPQQHPRPRTSRHGPVML